MGRNDVSSFGVRAVGHKRLNCRCAEEPTFLLEGMPTSVFFLEILCKHTHLSLVHVILQRSGSDCTNSLTAWEQNIFRFLS